ncbi:MAG: hypothetical protein D6780_03620, partial [Candidatus Dadabacteria bacterium]
LKGKLNTGEKDLSSYQVIAQNSDKTIVRAKVNSKGRFVLKGVKKGALFGLVKNGRYVAPLLFGIKNGKKILTFKKASKKGTCSKNTVEAYMSLKKRVKGRVKIVYDSSKSIAYAKKKVKAKFLSSKNLASIKSNCVPLGVAQDGTFGLSASSSSVRVLGAADTDGDGEEDSDDLDDDNDGVPDFADQDNDNDGTLDVTDSDNNDKDDTKSVWNFQQLHLDLDEAYNTQVMSVTTDMIDSALKENGGLAINVISGEIVELDCSGLSYCSTGGTGRAQEPFPDGQKFPEDQDSDGDGKGEITAGESGDFQLKPGATSSEILPGDTFIEEVTDSSGEVTLYVGTINSVVHDVPGVTKVSTSEETVTVSYPVSSGGKGTVSNPFLIDCSSAKGGEVTFTAYSAHYNIGGSKRVVPGKIRFVINVPNGPCTYDQASGQCNSSTSGPGLLPGTLYSNPSTGWAIVSDGIQSTNSTSTDEGEDSPVTFTVDLLGSGGINSISSGEQIKVPLMTLDEYGTTAAVNLWFKCM